VTRAFQVFAERGGNELRPVGLGGGCVEGVHGRKKLGKGASREQDVQRGFETGTPDPCLLIAWEKGSLKVLNVHEAARREQSEGTTMRKAFGTPREKRSSQ